LRCFAASRGVRFRLFPEVERMRAGRQIHAREFALQCAQNRVHFAHPAAVFRVEGFDVRTAIFDVVFPITLDDFETVGNDLSDTSK
jgi:hypothetical protein